MKKIFYLILVSISLAFAACSSKFDCDKANMLLNKSEMTEEEYSELIKIYEIGIDDTLKFASEGNDNLSEKQREEIITKFAIGKRLIMDEDKLTDKQVKEFERITKKGTDGLQK